MNFKYCNDCFFIQIMKTLSYLNAGSMTRMRPRYKSTVFEFLSLKKKKIAKK